MLKVAMLVSMFASMTMVGNLAVNKDAVKLKERNTQIIVEVDVNKDALTDEGIANTQKAVLNNIKNYATSNVSLLYNYKNLINAFAISVNEDDVDIIKQVPGVKSVTVNKLHWVTESVQALSDGETTTSGEYGRDDNISAETMHKPDNTAEGEGTVIAILDNEFYLKGAVKNTDGSITPGWHHEVYSPLGDDVALKFKGKISAAKVTIAAKAGIYDGDAPMGQEGSCYYNNKVPFYADYGGTVPTYSGSPIMDNDVVSDLTYHGSHVSSIAAANAENYKGIAPKAQLVLMKVFTDFYASEMDKKMGLTSYSGAYDLQIMNALEDCITLGVDGINMSLGSNLDDFDEDSATRIVIRNLIDSGIMTSISAGNAGKTSYKDTGAYSTWTKDMIETGILAGYANEAGAMTIASGQPTEIFYENGFDLGGSTVAFNDQIVNDEAWGTHWDHEYKMEDLFKDEEGGFTKSVEWVYVPGFGTPSDYTGLDVQGKIAVINRGNTSFEDKYKAAVESKGAIGVVIINNDPTANEFNFRCSFSEDFRPSCPLCLVLYKDKGLFEQTQKGSITLIHKQLLTNKDAYTMSNFSTDGATFDLDLKPDITAPGELIRGAVPPQKTEDRTEERRLHTYEYLSGTSMSAPNYAGCQSLLLSEVSAPIYRYLRDNPMAKMTQEQKDAIANRKASVDMIMMSTADPMHDAYENMEDHTKSITSPRKQGAGMVNLAKAYATDTYLEGVDEEGNGIGKSKVLLRNRPDINSGTINISFLAHNTGDTTHTYNAKLSVMRPATAEHNDVVTKNYQDRGEVDRADNFPGLHYWLDGVSEPEEHVVTSVTAEHNDVFTVNRKLAYYASAADCTSKTESYIEPGKYLNVGTASNIQWEQLESHEYQSVYDVEIANVSLGTVTIPAGDTLISLEPYSFTNEAKEAIAEIYDYGCYIEGYITLEAVDTDVDLSMPYLGYYSTMHDQGKDYSDSPIVEPFSFNKKLDEVYPSDLVNSIAHTLLGKDLHDMGSMWVTGYLEPGTTLDTMEVIKNNTKFSALPGFQLIGTDPTTGSYFDDVTNNLYVGNDNVTNTMIVQQFVLRSVKDNFFTIKNKKTGKIVYRDALEDAIFGGYNDTYPLYKSHVDETYLSAGYVAHRAIGIIPLYDVETGKPFESGDYEVTFNYLLAGTLTWESESYNIKVDSDAPEVSSITTSGNKVTINIKEKNLCKAVVGKQEYDFTKVSDDSYKIDLPKDEFLDIVNENLNEAQNDTGRLYVELTDKAYGTTGTIVRFKVTGRNPDWSAKYDLNSYTMVQNHKLKYNNDFVETDGKISVVEYNSSTATQKIIETDGLVLISKGPVKYQATTSGGCGGDIITTSTTLSVVALLSVVAIIISKRKKKVGGKN